MFFKILRFFIVVFLGHGSLALGQIPIGRSSLYALGSETPQLTAPPSPAVPPAGLVASEFFRPETRIPNSTEPNGVPELPHSHWQTFRNIAGKTKNDVFSDFKHLYCCDNALNFGVALLGAAALANTSIDRRFQDRYLGHQRSNLTQEISEFSKVFGEGKYFIPITVSTAFFYQYYWDQYEKTARYCGLGDFCGRTARGYAVGAPTLVIGQSILGSNRPRDGSSYWKPFQQNHGISGHAFIGAVPFITAAHMTDRLWLKGVFYTLSVLPAWSRVNDDAHYLSQVVLGWYLAYLSVRSVSETQGMKPLPRGLTIFPVVEESGVGIGLLYRR